MGKKGEFVMVGSRKQKVTNIKETHEFVTLVQVHLFPDMPVEAFNPPHLEFTRTVPCTTRGPYFRTRLQRSFCRRRCVRSCSCRCRETPRSFMLPSVQGQFCFH